MPCCLEQDTLRVRFPVQSQFCEAKLLPARGAQRIEAEIPQACRRQAEELEWKAWFPALRAGNALKFFF
jgi:hypothetical protein